MPAMKEIQVQTVHSIIASIKAAKDKGDTENVQWNWARAYSYADCLQSCEVISREEASKLQDLACVEAQTPEEAAEARELAIALTKFATPSQTSH
ncbi:MULTISPECIES: hypothetical protein [Pseudomonas]|uniref:Uncharacterized protein n=1 Tax=Pseudomonas fluorescens TaxID=294 RepID=A0A166QPJ2_PSEFL|nr:MULTISPECIES: hypothetical protein [Pseudomonas]KZN20644.1 hypothetical protein A1D17_03640 [Pseudomonas fluorescens]